MTCSCRSTTAEHEAWCERRPGNEDDSIRLVCESPDRLVRDAFELAVLRNLANTVRAIWPYVDRDRLPRLAAGDVEFLLRSAGKLTPPIIPAVAPKPPARTTRRRKRSV